MRFANHRSLVDSELREKIESRYLDSYEHLGLAFLQV
jgi:hypothetical protein